jgi:hypothetical protein
VVLHEASAVEVNIGPKWLVDGVGAVKTVDFGRMRTLWVLGVAVLVDHGLAGPCVLGVSGVRELAWEDLAHGLVLVVPQILDGLQDTAEVPVGVLVVHVFVVFEVKGGVALNALCLEHLVFWCDRLSVNFVFTVLADDLYVAKILKYLDSLLIDNLFNGFFIQVCLWHLHQETIGIATAQDQLALDRVPHLVGHTQVSADVEVLRQTLLRHDLVDVR